MRFSPSPLADALLRWTLGPEDAEVIGGDLEEIARRRIEPHAGSRAAHRWYTRQVLAVVVARMLASRAAAPDGQGRGTIIATVRQDLFYAARALRKQPGFTATAVLMLSLGIGATVAIFALANAVMLKPLPFGEPDRLMLVHLLAPDREGPAAGPTIWSYPKYEVFREHQRTFESSAAFASWSWNITGSDSPERIDGELVEDTYFHVLGLDPPLGRTFSAEETRAPGSARLVLLSHAIWMDRFGADRGVLGRTIGLNGTPYTIVGVMPPGFRGLTGQADLWVPVTTLSAADLGEKWNHSYYVVARRKSGITSAQSQAEARVLGDLIDARIGAPGGKRGVPWSATAVPLDEERVDPLIRRSIVLLLGAVVVVLLIVCINLGNLTLARGLARQRDVAIRLALGASRMRIARQLMMESALLAAAGATAALAVAYVLLSGGAALIPDLRTVLPAGPAASGLTRVGFGQLGFDWSTLVFTALAGASAAALFGLLPAWRASRRDLSMTMRVGPSVSSGTRRRVPTHHLLVAGEVALALVLLTAAGLMLKSVVRLQATELGFDPRSVVSVRLVLPGPQYNGERATQFLEELLGRLGSRGDVESVAYGSCAPVQGGCNGTTVKLLDRPADDAAPNVVVGVMWASPSYFETLRIQLVRGRVFTERDRAGHPKVVVVNETAARVFWPGADPIGKRISVGQGGFGEGAQVVGIVGDVRYGPVDQPVRPGVYLPVLQSRRAWGAIFVKSRAPAASVVSTVRADVRALDPDLPLTDIRTMSERVEEATWRTRLSAWLLGAFATLALLLVALGIYGVVSQSVQQRTREIGVRLAVGAGRRDIMRLILGHVLAVAATGLVAGLAVTFPSTRLLATLLYQVRPDDPWVLGPLALMLLVVALVAAYIPARRATRVDPVATLRAE